MNDRGSLGMEVGDGVADLTKGDDEGGQVETTRGGAKAFDGVKGRASLAVLQKDEMLC